MKEIKLKKFTYHPGYSDMRGARHEEVLRKNESGEWMITSEDREYYNDLLRITSYAVSPDKVEAFERFLKDKKILSLSKRLKSKVFVTDYSPWEYRIMLEEGTSYRDECRITEYKMYSERDKGLLKELNMRFKELHGEKISEEIQKEGD